jgi:integrase
MIVLRWSPGYHDKLHLVLAGRYVFLSVDVVRDRMSGTTVHPHLSMRPTSPDEIDRFLGKLQCGDERVHGYFRAIRAVYHFLERRHRISIIDNPIRMMDAPRTSPKQPRPLSPDHIKKLLSYPHASKIKAAIILLAATGCRVGEVATLQKDNLLESPFGPVIQVNGKRGERYIPITQEIYHQLHNELPFPWCKEWLGHLIKDAFKKVGIPGSAINLRHSFATYWAGEDLVLQELMGHSSISTTRRYRKMRLSYVISQYNTHTPLLPLLHQPERML